MKCLTREEWRKFNRAKNCHIRFKGFKEDDIKVKDHCHFTGSHRGLAHRSCNLAYKIPHYIPIVFHNLSGYDAHVFIRELGDKFNTGNISIIAENKEKYISFIIDVVEDQQVDASVKVKENST